MVVELTVSSHLKENTMSAAPPIPANTRAVVLHAYGQPPEISVETRTVPQPRAGEVLLRMHAAPINPSDLAALRGLYRVRKTLPAVPGFEGSGTVVASGGGVLARLLLGRRVACAAPEGGDGTWAEFMLTSAQTCIPLSRNLSFEQGAMFIVNPLTAWSLMEITRREGHRTIVQTAAASALGKMIVRLARQRKVVVINIVRRDEQTAALRALGAEHVLNSSDRDFDTRLLEICRREGARLAFDAVGGALTGKVLSAMPEGGRLISYGGLAHEPCMLDPRSFINEGKRLEGFYLGRAMRELSMRQRLVMVRRVQQIFRNEFHTEIQARVPLQEAARGLQLYQQNMSAGKVLLMMEKSSAQ